MAFYVKLGPRGVLFRIGTVLIGCMGSLVYWRASRRRGMMMRAARLAPALVEN